MIFYPVFVQSPNLETLTKELMTALALANVNCGNANGFYVEVPDHITLEQVQTVVDAHDPATLTTSQQESAQAASAKTALKTLMTGLHGLSAADKGYALYCRIFAARDGANQATLDGITNRATATAYITGLPEWGAMTAASRAFFAKELEANAGLTMVLLLVLT